MAKIGYAMDPGPKNQDVLVAKRSSVDRSTDKRYDFFAVIDGHGENNVAADIASQQLSEACFNRECPMPPNESIVQGFYRVNAQIHYKMRTDKIHRSGAAVACVFVTENMTKIAWVGDVKAALIDHKGKIIFVTTDHNLTTNAKERLRINKCCQESSPREKLMENAKWQAAVVKARSEGKILRSKSFLEQQGDKYGHFLKWYLVAHEGGIKLKLSRTLGDLNAARSAIPEPEIYSINFAKPVNPQGSSSEGIKFVLASATFWAVVSPKNLQSGLKRFDWRKGNLEERARQLVSLAKARRTKRGFVDDDISVMLIYVNGPTTDRDMSQLFTSSINSTTNSFKSSN